MQSQVTALKNMKALRRSKKKGGGINALGIEGRQSKEVCVRKKARTTSQRQKANVSGNISRVAYKGTTAITSC